MKKIKIAIIGLLFASILSWADVLPNDYYRGPLGICAFSGGSEKLLFQTAHKINALQARLVCMILSSNKAVFNFKE
jgi:hypothetical protein